MEGFPGHCLDEGQRIQTYMQLGPSTLVRLFFYKTVDPWFVMVNLLDDTCS